MMRPHDMTREHLIGKVVKLQDRVREQAEFINKQQAELAALRAPIMLCEFCGRDEGGAKEAGSTHCMPPFALHRHEFTKPHPYLTIERPPQGPTADEVRDLRAVAFNSGFLAGVEYVGHKARPDLLPRAPSMEEARSIFMFCKDVFDWLDNRESLFLTLEEANRLKAAKNPPEEEASGEQPACKWVHGCPKPKWCEGKGYCMGADPIDRTPGA